MAGPQNGSAVLLGSGAKRGGSIGQKSADNFRGLEGLDPFFFFDTVELALYKGGISRVSKRVYVN